MEVCFSPHRLVDTVASASFRGTIEGAERPHLKLNALELRKEDN